MTKCMMTKLICDPHHALGMRPPVPETILEKLKINGP